MKIYKASRMVSILLIAAMLFTMTGVSAFAEGGGEGAGSEEKETKNLLVFGASTSSGYGLSDFYNSNRGFAVDNNDLNKWTYEEAERVNQGRDDVGRMSEEAYPWKLKKYVAETEFGYDPDADKEDTENYAKLNKVNLSPLCLNGMRTNELHAFLDSEYAQAAYDNEKEIVGPTNTGFYVEHLESIIGCMSSGGAKVDMGDGKGEVSICDPGDNRRDPSSTAYKRAHEYVVKEIEKADVVVVDVCMNNFGTYLACRLSGKYNIPGFGRYSNLWKETPETIIGASPELVEKAATLKKTMQMMVPMLKDNDNIDFIIDSFIYCLLDAMTNLSADIQLIRDINPDAKIITVGVYNTLDGITVELDGEEYDFGAITAKGFQLLNLYIKSLDKNSNYYYYADVQDNIETFMNQVVGSDNYWDFISGDPENDSLMEKMYFGTDSFYNTFMQPYGLTDPEEYKAPAKVLLYRGAKKTRLHMNELMSNLENLFDPNGIGSEISKYFTGVGVLRGINQTDGLKDLPDSDRVTILSYAMDQILDGNNFNDAVTVAATGYYTQSYSWCDDGANKEIAKSIAYAAATADYTINEGVIEVISEDDAAEGIGVSAEDKDKIPSFPSESSMELLQILDRFIVYQGIGQHPSKKGCESMYQDVKVAYDKSQTDGNTAFDDFKEDLLSLLDGTPAADEIKDLLEMKEKAAPLIARMDEISALFAVIDENGLTADQLEELLELKKEYEDKMTAILNALGLNIEDLDKELSDIAENKDGKLDKLVEKYNQLKELIEIIDEEDLTPDQLKQLLKAKDDLVKDMNLVLKAFDLTADELMDMMHETANDEKKMEEIVKKVKMLQEVMEIIDDEELTPEQLKQLLETKDKLTERVVEILKHYDLTLEDLEKALNDDATLEEIDKYIEKLAQIKEAMDLLDEEGLTVDQLKQLLETKDKLAERVGEILKHYDLTLEDLEKALNDDATLEEIDKYIEKLAQIKEAMDLLDEEGLTVDQLKEALQIKEDLEARINDTLDSLGLTMDDVIKAIDENTTPEKLAEYIEKYKQISEILYLIDESGIDADQIKELLDLKDQIWQRIQTAQEFINEKIKQYISDELLEQIKEIGNKLINATDAEDYEQILKDLAPILDRLKEIGLAVYNLPEYEEAMDAYAELLDQFAEEAVDMRDEIDTLKSQIKTYEKKLEEQDAKFAELTAKTIFVNMKTAVKFPKKTVQVVVSWDAEADAAGYVLKVNGKEKAAVATAKGFQYKDDDVKVGKTTTYEVTPFVEYKGEKLYGRTYTKKVTPKVSLKKVTLKKVKGAKKALKIKWKKVAKANGYQVSYKVGKKTQYKNVKGAKKVTLNLKKLQGGKEYTVKVRAWKKVDGKKYYGKWSAAKKATTEK